MAQLAILAVMLFWGLSFVASKAILNTGFPPMTMVLIRFLIASAILLPFQLRLGRRGAARAEGTAGAEGSSGRGGRLALLLSACFGIGLYFLFETRGIRLTSAANAALITAIIPALTVGAEYLLYRIVIRWHQGLGIALSVVGVYFIVQRSQGRYEDALWGNLAMLGACLCWVAYNLASRRAQASYSGMRLTTYQALIGAAVLLPMAIAEFRSWTLPGPGVWLELLYLGVVCSALSYFLYLYALSRLGAVAVTSYINLLPFIGAVGGVALLGERLLAVQVVGGLVVAAGVFLVNWRGRAAAPTR
jgi:drug/metabolite transporter (DMT)-like permease